MALPRLLRGTVAGALASAALAGFNYLADEAAPPLEPWLEGDRRDYTWRMGRVRYTVAGPEAGEPLLMVHGIHAAASSYEFRRNFGVFADEGYRVYALDLLGFGQSERPALDYDDELYIALISDFLRDVIDQPAIVIVTSLSGSFVVPTALRHPDRITKLVMIAPVGLERLRSETAVSGALLRGFVRSPLVGEGFFNLLTTRPSLRYFMGEQGYHDSSLVTDEMIDHYYATSHQPNARYAVAAFVSGRLNRDLRNEWPRVTQPTLLVWGNYATTTPAKDGTEFLRLNPRAVVDGYDANLLPHDEQSERFNRQTLAWLQGRRKD
ncbi:MAG: alpha/beta fold hydrolase [Anaerolineales bacterium]|nr:alpha/beta fold hydrolase [Anaerolineales bacterium]MCB9128374.1 alpha/beta fold hydrolase [Ardenticatenales bacterium]